MTTNAAPNEGERYKFPKKHLVTGERILWEGRPSIVVYFLRSLLLFVFGGLFGVMAILQSNQVHVLIALQDGHNPEQATEDE